MNKKSLVYHMVLNSQEYCDVFSCACAHTQEPNGRSAEVNLQEQFYSFYLVCHGEGTHTVRLGITC